MKLPFELEEQSSHQQRVEHFMRQARQPLPEEPLIPSEEIRRLRAKLILEEALETIKALGFVVRGADDEDPWVDKYIHLDPDLEQIIDGCCDLKVVTTGTLSACGVMDLIPQVKVDNNNLQKFAPGHYWREDGKLVKPENHKPVDWKLEISRQKAILENLKRQQKLEV